MRRGRNPRISNPFTRACIAAPFGFANAVYAHAYFRLAASPRCRARSRLPTGVLSASRSASSRRLVRSRGAWNLRSGAVIELSLPSRLRWWRWYRYRHSRSGQKMVSVARGAPTFLIRATRVRLLRAYGGTVYTGPGKLELQAINGRDRQPTAAVRFTGKGTNIWRCSSPRVQAERQQSPSLTGIAGRVLGGSSLTAPRPD